MTIGSLFSGIGGLELGLERAGLGPVMWQCEIDPFALAVLERHWPEATRVRDVRDVSPKTVREVSLICGGFPCQDVSVAGKGAGLAGERSGLWSEFRRVVDECQPATVVVENVAQGISRWLPAVVGDLRGLGYVPCPIVLSAGECGAPHRRARAFVVADTDGSVLRLIQQRQPGRPSRGVRDEGQAVAVDDGGAWRSAGASAWTSLPRVGRVGNGIPGRVDGAGQRTDRLRVLGNAVVPHVAEVIGRIIVAAHGRSS
jgi:DNA (cytosine-5)-methyltransferase 1